MDRLFLDANILFSAAYRAGAGLAIFWKLPDVVLCSSRYALEEARINLDGSAQRKRLSRLERRVHLFETARREIPSGVSLPEKDVPILLAALGARAIHLITGDMQHFGQHFGKRIEGILVQAPAEYLKSRVER